MKLFSHSNFSTEQILTGDVLELGCGRNKLPGVIGVDCVDFPGVDYVVDLNSALPFEDKSFDVIYSNQVLEHIHNLVGLLSECHRILRPGGVFIAHVPYFRSSWAAIDPTHIRQFTISSMNYFVNGTYEYKNYRFIDQSFNRVDCYLDWNYPRSILRWAFTKLALKYPVRFENSLLSFLYPFQSLTFVLLK